MVLAISVACIYNTFYSNTQMQTFKQHSIVTVFVLLHSITINDSYREVEKQS